METVLLLLTLAVLPCTADLLHDAYASTFRLRDGSALASVDTAALEAMRGSVERLLAVRGGLG